MKDHQWFEKARALLQRSTCLKTQTAAVIVKNDALVACGYNLCAPENIVHGATVAFCPRMDIQTGGRYDLCRPLHAEVMACLNIRKNRSLDDWKRFASPRVPTHHEIRAAFTPEEQSQLHNSALYLVGHYYACDDCQRFLETLAITDIRFDPLSRDAARQRYEENNLA